MCCILKTNQCILYFRISGRSWAQILCIIATTTATLMHSLFSLMCALRLNLNSPYSVGSTVCQRAIQICASKTTVTATESKRGACFGFDSCLHWIRRSERVQQYCDTLQLCGLNYFPLQERRSDGERRSVPAFRLQIGTGAQTFDEFLDAVCPLSLSSEEDIFWVLIILSSDLTTVELAHLKSSDVGRRRKEMPLADHWRRLLFSQFWSHNDG